MASHCAHCRSTDVVHNANTYTCFNCGESTSSDGTALDKGESSRVVVSGRPKATRKTTEKSR